MVKAISNTSSGGGGGTTNGGGGVKEAASDNELLSSIASSTTDPPSELSYSNAAASVIDAASGGSQRKSVRRRSSIMAMGSESVEGDASPSSASQSNRPQLETQPEVRFDPSNLPFQLVRFFKSGDFRKIERHPDAWPFREPVDDVSLDIPDYYKVIKNPMDFRTLKQRYHNGWYKSVSHFLSDFKLIFNNCYRYNSAVTDIHAMARDLELFSQQFIKPLEDIAATENSEVPKVSNLPPPIPNSFVDALNSKEKKTSHKRKANESAMRKNQSHEDVRNKSFNVEQKTFNASKDNHVKKAKTSFKKRNHDTSLLNSPNTSPSDTFSSPESSSMSNAKLSKIKSSPKTTNNPNTSSAQTDPVEMKPSMTPLSSNQSQLSSKKSLTQTPNRANPADQEQRFHDIVMAAKHAKQMHFDPYIPYSKRHTEAMELKMHQICTEILATLKSPLFSSIMWPFYAHPPHNKYPDLEFVEMTLQSGRYATIDEFATAIRHIFMNVITQYDRDSQFVKLAHMALEVFHDIYTTHLQSSQLILNTTTTTPSNSTSPSSTINHSILLPPFEHRLDEIYELLMRDCDLQRRLNDSESKVEQIEKRLGELEKQFSAHKFHTTLTVDKLRKRISYLKSKQQSDLIYIHESFQVAVKKAAAQAAASYGASPTAIVNGQPPHLTIESNKHFREKFRTYTRNKGIMPLKEMDQMEQTSRSILLSGNSKSDDEEESVRALTAEEKRKLSHDINRLSQKMLAELIEIITKSENLDPNDEHELILDYDKMKPATLRTVQSFVQSCVKRLPRLKQIQNIPVTHFESNSKPQQQQQRPTPIKNANQLSDDELQDSLVASKSAPANNHVSTQTPTKHSSHPLFHHSQPPNPSDSTISTSPTTTNTHSSPLMLANSPIGATSNSGSGNVQQQQLVLNNRLLNLKKKSGMVTGSGALVQLNAAVQSLKDNNSTTNTTSSSIGTNTTSSIPTAAANYPHENAFAHLLVNNSNTGSSNNNSGEREEASIQSNQLPTTKTNNAWSRFASDLNATTNLDQIKAIDDSFKSSSTSTTTTATNTPMIVGSDTNREEEKREETNTGSIENLESHNADNNETSQNLIESNANSSPTTANHPSNTNSTQNSPENNSATNQHPTLTPTNSPNTQSNTPTTTLPNLKESLKAEAQKKRAAATIDRNESVIQREMMSSFEESSNFIS